MIGQETHINVTAPPREGANLKTRPIVLIILAATEGRRLPR